jgi:hypothetical protein
MGNSSSLATEEHTAVRCDCSRGGGGGGVKA